MRLALALWCLGVIADATSRVGLRHSKQPSYSGALDAALRARSEVARFGPSHCISTWRNEDGHCELETKCKDQNISDYSVKFICLDDGGEKVRHVFAAGSFDPEERFDTLIECKKCLAEKEDIVQPLDTTSSEDGGNVTLGELKNEVDELEDFMMNTSEALQKLNAKVYSETYTPPPEKKPMPEVAIKANAKAEKAASSLVHHSSSHHHMSDQPLHVEVDAARVKKEHRRHLRAVASGEEDAKTPTIDARALEAATDSERSLAKATRTAEYRDEQIAVKQPQRSRMLPMAEQKPVKLKADVPRSEFKEDDDDGDDSDSDASTSPVQASDQDDDTSERPSMYALARSEDDDSNSEETVAEEESD